MKKYLFIIFFVIIILAVIGGIAFLIINQKVEQTLALSEDQENQIEKMIAQRRQQQADLGQQPDHDPFNEQGIVKILFIGLDNRIGQTNGHCDAIQLIEINKAQQTITITAVPRGTYSPLPGSGHLPTDYYVSKSCEIGGLDYGIQQIEKILNQQADYVVFLGFSQAMGIFRQLDLPASETMQWLRMRQAYAIGEPQRARNHSTFIKQMIIKFSPQVNSFNLTLARLLWPLIRTDLSFSQAVTIAKTVAELDTPKQPERITLLMRPPYNVTDIPYQEENLNENIDKLIKPIADIIPENAYTGQSKNEVEEKILTELQDNLTDQEFIKWAYQNYLWLQIEDETKRETAHYQILERYISLLSNQEEKNQIISDYIIEMENLDQPDWAQQGRDLLESIN